MTEDLIYDFLRQGLWIAVKISAPLLTVALVTGITLDSRAVEHGWLYVALPGTRAHGAEFAGSAVAAVSMLKKRGFETIVFVCIVSCPEGVARLEQAHPDVAIYTASIDDGLNASKYILPGLGDAGDRLFGTK